MLYFLGFLLLLSIVFLKKPLQQVLEKYPLPVMTYVFLICVFKTKTDIGSLEFVLSLCALWVILVLSYSFGYYVGHLYERLNDNLKAHNSVTIAIFQWLKNEPFLLSLIGIITAYFTM
jgi:hypothetical protein